jgi:uncharacterized protein (DUF2252 family)
MPVPIPALLGSLLACSGATDDASRASTLHEFLLRENSIWLSRDTSLLESKYAAMGSDPYDFMRGTAGWYYSDVGRTVGERADTRFLTEPDASEILLVGDAHPENLSTTVPGACPGPEDPEAALALEFIDLDTSTYGPWLLELRRAGLGLAMFGYALPGCESACRDAAAEALARAYGETLVALSEGGAAGGFPQDAGELVAHLEDEAREEGPERKKLNKYTALDAEGRRYLLVDEALDEEGAGHLAPIGEEAAQIERLFALWASEVGGGRLLDAARRYGSGVSSRPATRYLLLWDSGDDGPDDDALLTLRELLGPASIPGAPQGDPFPDDAARIEEANATLWSAPDSDACSRGLMDGDQAFKTLSYGSWFQDINHEDAVEDWQSGDLVEADYLGLAEATGRTLAAAHARGRTADDAPALPVLAADLGSDVEGLAEELVTSSAADLEIWLEDYRRLRELLETWGPLLGADTVVVDDVE